MHWSLQDILTILETYKYLIIFPISIVEGPVIAPLTGILVSLGVLHFGIAFVVLLIGDLVGDALFYAIGRYGGHWAIHRWGSLIGISDTNIQVFEKIFTTRGAVMLLLGKAHITGLPTGLALLTAAGASKMKFVSFMFWNTVGSVPKIGLLMLIGYFLGKGFLEAHSTYSLVTGVFSLGIMFLLILITIAIMRTVARIDSKTEFPTT